MIGATQSLNEKKNNAAMWFGIAAALATLPVFGLASAGIGVLVGLGVKQNLNANNNEPSLQPETKIPSQSKARAAAWFGLAAAMVTAPVLGFAALTVGAAVGAGTLETLDVVAPRFLSQQKTNPAPQSQNETPAWFGLAAALLTAPTLGPASALVGVAVGFGVKRTLQTLGLR